MEWRDDGIVLAARRHGETAAVVSMLTRAHGRHAGLAHGGGGRRGRGLYQPGNRVIARWRARLPEHLGTFSCELVHAYAARFFDDRPRLTALTAACSLVEATLAEREPHPALFDATVSLLAALERDSSWPRVYVAWELALLQELGFGLDLSACAVTGATEGLRYVSPKTGRAVTEEAGRAYRERLLALPGFLVGRADHDPQDVLAGLRLSGHFLHHRVAPTLGVEIPSARERLWALLAGQAASPPSGEPDGSSVATTGPEPGPWDTEA